MKSHARAYIRWPKLKLYSNNDNLARLCILCQQTSASPSKIPLHPWEWLSQTWSRLHLDFAGPFLGRMYVVVVDAYSKWFDVQLMNLITSKSTTAKLKGSFATHELPQKLVVNIGPYFTTLSSTFKAYIDQNCIKQNCTVLYIMRPSSNGLAERTVQTFTQSSYQIRYQLGSSVREKLAKFLLRYQITPHSSMGVTPAELLMGRWLQFQLDFLKPDLATTMENSQLKQKLTHDSKQNVH